MLNKHWSLQKGFIMWNSLANSFSDLFCQLVLVRGIQRDLSPKKVLFKLQSCLKILKVKLTPEQYLSRKMNPNSGYKMEESWSKNEI